jgi:hypothetical protein
MVSTKLNTYPNYVSAFHAWGQARALESEITPKNQRQKILALDALWTSENIHIIAKALFGTIEGITDEVGPPNNTRITSKYGRSDTLVEENWVLKTPRKRSTRRVALTLTSPPHS